VTGLDDVVEVVQVRRGGRGVPGRRWPRRGHVGNGSADTCHLGWPSRPTAAASSQPA
jgi:hypothetical protein